MIKSNNFGSLTGRLYNVQERNKSVTFSIGIVVYNPQKKETEMQFFSLLTVFDNLKKLLLKLEKGAELTVLYTLFPYKNKDGLQMTGLKAHDVTMLGSRQSNSDGGNYKKTYNNTKKEQPKKAQTVEKEEPGDIEIDELPDDLKQFFKQ